MRTPTTLLAGSLAGVALALAVPAGGLAQEPLIATGVTLKRPQPAATRTFTGFLKSRNQDCFDHRKVQLWRRTSRTAFRKKVAWTYAEKRPEGQPKTTSLKWSLTVVRSGWYHAEVLPTDKCAGRKSTQVHFTRPL